MKRASAVVRAWDGPNSRVAFEMDLDQMPWGPFEALGKRVTLLVPAHAGDEASEGSPESNLERALRHVEHAAEKCAEFAELGNSDQLWRTSLETWEWLRDFLTAALMEGESNGAGAAPPGKEAFVAAAPERATPAPDMPGAAATLDVAATALRRTPLSVWREAVGTYNPDAPTREEAVRTLQGVARLLGASAAEPNPTEPTGAASAGDSPADGSRPAPPSTEGGTEGAPGVEDGLSFDYASGYDEGYRMGRRVGRALAARSRDAGRD